jgi:hypothetical protein
MLIEEPKEEDDVRVFGVAGSAGPMENVVELLPKNLRQKARMLMYHLRGKINLDSQGRLLYAGSNQPGSHYLDMIKFLVTAKNPAIGRSLNRPIDLPQFLTLMREVGIPQSCLGKGRTIEDPARQQSSPPPKKRKPTGTSKNFKWIRL